MPAAATAPSTAGRDAGVRPTHQKLAILAALLAALAAALALFGPSVAE